MIGGRCLLGEQIKQYVPNLDVNYLGILQCWAICFPEMVKTLLLSEPPTGALASASN